ncbi:MAG: SURF1 family protein [Alphaproteobacteria bacterium]|nr:SURF1 family protein [Alphaproteobacteria bacterium]
MFLKHLSSFSIFTFFMILVLLGLGTWQLHRKAEKETLLHTIHQQKSKPPQNVDFLKTFDPFSPLYANGHFIPGKTIYLQSKVHHGKNGVYVFDVFQTQKGLFLLVQRGWSEKEIAPSPSERIRLEGIIRTPSPPTYFQPANTTPLYFWIDLQALSRDLNAPLLPFYLVATHSYDAKILPTPPLPTLSNHHLQYAITWYFLAFTLLVMFLWNRKSFLKRKTSDGSDYNS